MQTRVTKLNENTIKQFGDIGQCYKTISLGSVLGTIKQGDLWLVDDNSVKVLVVYILGDYILFLQGNDIYSQKAEDFISDINISAVSSAGQRLLPLATNLELAARYGIGLAVTVSGPAFIGFIAVEVVSFVIQNKDKIPRWVSAIIGINGQLQVIKLWWPAMYRVIDETLFSELIDKIPSNINTENGFFCAGQIMGVVFKRDIKTFTVIILDILEIMMKGLIMCIKTIPAAMHTITANMNASNFKLALNELIREFLNKRIRITPSQAMDIINQYRSNPLLLEQTLKKLLEELNKLK